jgi:dienelactone hydrolase
MLIPLLRNQLLGAVTISLLSLALGAESLFARPILKFYLDDELKHPVNSILKTDSFITVIEGLAPSQDIILRTQMYFRHAGTDQAKLFQAESHFKADSEGRISLDKQAPLKGDYYGVDQDGPVWSLLENNTASVPQILSQPSWSLLFSVFTTGSNSEKLVEEFLERKLSSVDIKITPINEQGIVGTLFIPQFKSQNKLPVLIMMGGSEGAQSYTSDAPSYASQGYAVLTLAYFKEPGLPAELNNVPLEYFGKAFKWLETQPSIDAKRIGIMGASRGGELVLLLGTLYPQVKAIVAMSPSSYVWGACCNIPGTFPSWTLNGKPLDFLHLENMKTDFVLTPNQDIYEILTGSFMKRIAILTDAEKERVLIPVEKIEAPMLFIGGEQDLVWPSCTFMNLSKQRLKAANKLGLTQFLCFPNAGHNISRPPGDGTRAAPLRLNRNTGIHAVRGGEPQSIARARRVGWQQILQFFEKNL